MTLETLQTFDGHVVGTKIQKDKKDNKTKIQKDRKTETQKDRKTKRQKDNEIKRQKDKKEEKKEKKQRPKREFNIVTSGQFRTLAMFWLRIPLT